MYPVLLAAVANAWPTDRLRLSTVAADRSVGSIRCDSASVRMDGVEHPLPELTGTSLPVDWSPSNAFWGSLDLGQLDIPLPQVPGFVVEVQLAGATAPEGALRD